MHEREASRTLEEGSSKKVSGTRLIGPVGRRFTALIPSSLRREKQNVKRKRREEEGAHEALCLPCKHCQREQQGERDRIANSPHFSVTLLDSKQSKLQ